MMQQNNFLHLEIKKGRVWRGARGWGLLTPHGMYPVVWTIYKADSSIKYVFSSQTGLGAISHCSCPRDVWRVPERLSSQTWLLDEAYEGGRAILFLGSRDVRKDDSWQMHHSQWLPVLLEDCAEESCSSCTGNIWTRVRRPVWPWKAE